MPQMPSRQSESNAIGVLALLDQPFVDDVEHLEERHVGRDVVGRVVDEAARPSGPPAARFSEFSFTGHLHVSLQLASAACSSHRRRLLVAPLRRVHFLEHQRLLVQHRRLADAL